MVLNNLRLLMIANMVPDCDCVADIGTDHALLPIYLVLNNKCKKVIASDVRKGPLKSAMRNIKKYGLEDKIETRMGSGLQTINQMECQVAVLAGMGGYLITELLKESMDVVQGIPNLIIQPNTEEDTVRKFLYDNSFEILKEDAVVDKGHCYLSILCRYVPGLEEMYTDLELITGKILYKQNSERAKDYYGNLKAKAMKVIKKLERVENKNDEIKRRLEENREIVRWIDNNVEGI